MSWQEWAVKGFFYSNKTETYEYTKL